MDKDSMGFYKDGTQPESVTNQLTLELEGVRAKKAARGEGGCYPS